MLEKVIGKGTGRGLLIGLLCYTILLLLVFYMGAKEEHLKLTSFLGIGAWVAIIGMIVIVAGMFIHAPLTEED